MTKPQALEAARQRCVNGCRNSVINDTPMTCRRCEEAGLLAWELILRDREELASECLPIDGSCDNLRASQIGELVKNAFRAPTAGDNIDRGLALLRLLGRQGFRVVKQ